MNALGAEVYDAGGFMVYFAAQLLKKCQYQL